MGDVTEVVDLSHDGKKCDGVKNNSFIDFVEIKPSPRKSREGLWKTKNMNILSLMLVSVPIKIRPVVFKLKFREFQVLHSF